MLKSQSKRGISLLLAGLCVFALTGLGSQVAAKTQLIYWTFIDPAGDTPRGRALRQLIEKFETENPTLKIKVELTGWVKCIDKLIQASAAKKGPDVVRIPLHRARPVLDLDLLAPIDEYITGWTEEEKNDFVYPWRVGFKGGHKYFFSYSTKFTVFQYRQDLLKQAGLVPPRDLYEVAQNAAKLNDENTLGFSFSIARKEKATVLMEGLSALIQTEGGEIIGKDGKAAFDSEAGMRVFRWVYDLYHTYKAIAVDRATISASEEEGLLRAGILAQRIGNCVLVAYAREGEGVGDNLQTIPIPSFDFMLPARPYMMGDTVAIGAYSKHKDEAWKFIEAYLRPDNQLILAKVGHERPGRRSAYDDSWFRTSPEGKEILYWTRYADRLGSPFIQDKNWDLAADMLALAMQQIVIEGKPVEKTIAETAERFNAEVTSK